MNEEIDRLRAEVERLRKEYSEIAHQALRERDEARAARDHFKEQLRERADALLDARAEVERLRWLAEAGCENTPTKGCECPGCCTARERAERGEA